LHEIGSRMVADLAELHGWDTCYLGASTPAESVAAMVGEFNADLLAISATMSSHVRRAEQLIRHVRSAQPGRPLAIMVGGSPFNQSPELWRTVGADATAPDARAALDVACRLAA